MLYAIDSITKSKIEVVSKEEMNTYIQEQVSSLLSSGEGLSMFGVTATATELNYCSGLTSNIQTQLNAKQSTITGGASTIVSSNLTASRALISNSSGKIAVSAVTSTELGYLDGVTSNIQTQLNKLTSLNNLYPVNINKNITFSSGTATVSLGYTITKCYLAVIPIWDVNNFSGIASVSSDGNLTIKGYSGSSDFTGTQWLNIIGLVKRS